MKKKHIFLTLIISLFAAGSIISMHLAQTNHAMDVSLADISVMAQADGESGGGTLYCCPSIHDCLFSPGYLCVWCGWGDDKCQIGWDVREYCGLAGTCYQ